MNEYIVYELRRGDTVVLRSVVPSRSPWITNSWRPPQEHLPHGVVQWYVNKGERFELFGDPFSYFPEEEE